LYTVAVEDSAMGKNAIDVNDKVAKKVSCLFGLPLETMCLAISPAAGK
jgi:hypothetical protein